MTDTQPDDVRRVEGTKELEQELVTVEAALDGIFEAAERAAATSGEGAGLILEKLLDLIYERFAPQIPYDRIGLAIVEEDGGVVRSRWARSDADSLTMGTGHAAPVDDTVVQEILGTGVPMIVNDLEAYLEENSDSEPTRLIVSEGMRSSLTCPLAAAGKPVGLMVFSSKEPNTYDEDHRAMLEHIAEHVATILERSRLYERLGELNWQLRIAKDALEYQATHDGLTRLYNRSAILDTAEQEMERAGRRGRPITIVMCDIDHFKAINDAHGHLVGDRVLQAVADRLKEALRSYETVGRYGGEEFLITLYDCDAEGAPHAMERLRTAVGGEGIETTKGVVNVSISLGAAAGNGNEADLDTFIRLADEAMYEAKEAGRDRYAVRVVEGDDR
ncbi:MAG: sensor domain-containing diguanylate cyclase [Acidobacteriota bacterium]|jgi:diguanylate cyclase (GGDEF)-like protein